MFETADIPITPEVFTLIAEIDEFKGAWRALGTLAPERLVVQQAGQRQDRIAIPGPSFLCRNYLPLLKLHCQRFAENLRLSFPIAAVVCKTSNIKWIGNSTPRRSLWRAYCYQRR
jgi:hypothetical protein